MGSNLKKVLVIKLRHHGDVLLGTALYRALVEQFPGLVVDTLVYQETTPLLENNPHLRRVLTINRKLKGWQRVKAEWALLWSIRRESYDAVIHLTDQWIGALIARMSRAPQRIEMFYAKRDSAFWHKSFTQCVRPPARGEAHAVELNLLCLSALGVNPAEVQGRMALEVPQARLQQVDDWLTREGIRSPFVLIHPAARWPFKCWEDEAFADVVAGLMRKGYDVVLTCAPDAVEKAMTDQIERIALEKAQDAPQRRLLNLGGQVSLPLVAAMLRRCRFYIGVDSAPMHMAAALDVPQIALFGPSWVNEWRPWSNQATVIYAGDYGPLPHPDSINTEDTTRLLKAIPTPVVLVAIDALEQRIGSITPNRQA